MIPSWHGLLLGGTIVLSLALTRLVRRLALALQIGLPRPRPRRDIHRRATPRLGGVAVSLTFLLVTLIVYLTSPQALTFVAEKVGGIDRNLLGIVLGVLLLLGVGVVDDLRGLPPLTKLFFHFLAGAILAASQVLIWHLTNPFGGKIVLGDWTYLFVILWVVFMINVINFLDGLDGLASGVGLIATLVLYLLAINPVVNQPSMAVLAVVLGGTLIGFLPLNFYPAKIFLGDAGSQVLGFLLAAFAIISGAKLATAFLVLGVPILDVFWVIGRRIIARQPVYQADRYHIHHRLLRAGLGQREAVLLLYSVSAAFGIIALQTQTMGKLIAAGGLIAIMILGGAALVILAGLRKAPARA